MNFQVYEQILPRGVFRVFNQKPEFLFYATKQTHSNIVIPEKNIVNNLLIEADGICGNSNIPKSILTADCLPLVIIGRNGHATIHAGWRGIKDKIIEHEIVKKIEPYFAYIGPHIRVHNYEVQQDFINQFPDTHSSIQKGNKFYFDMAQEVSLQLKNNYSNITIEDCRLCTFDDKNFHSYRRNKTTERNYNIYFPNGENQ